MGFIFRLYKHVDTSIGISVLCFPPFLGSRVTVYSPICFTLRLRGPECYSNVRLFGSRSFLKLWEIMGTIRVVFHFLTFDLVRFRSTRS